MGHRFPPVTGSIISTDAGFQVSAEGLHRAVLTLVKGWLRAPLSTIFLLDLAEAYGWAALSQLRAARSTLRRFFFHMTFNKRTLQQMLPTRIVSVPFSVSIFYVGAFFARTIYHFALTPPRHFFPFDLYDDSSPPEPLDHSRQALISCIFRRRASDFATPCSQVFFPSFVPTPKWTF